MNPKSIAYNSDSPPAPNRPIAANHPSVQSRQNLSAGTHPAVGPAREGRLGGKLERIEVATGRFVEHIGRAVEGLGRRLETTRSAATAPAPNAKRRNTSTASPSRVNNSFHDSFGVAAVFMISVLVFAAGVILSSAIVALLGFIAVLCGVELYSRVLV